MKKIITIGCLLVSVFFVNNNAVAQSVGAGLAYGSEIEAIGIQVNGVYGFTDEIRGAANFTLFFPDQPSDGDYSFWTLNADVHYLFMAEEATNVYGLGGLNFASQEISSGGFSASDSEIGLNLGGGAEFGMGFGSLFAEVKYVISDFDQLVLNAGVRFDL